MPPGTGTATTELLGLHPPGVGDEESSVVGNKSLLQLDSRGSILVLGVEGNDTLGDSLSESVELRDVTTTLDTETDVHVGEPLGANDEDGLVDLVSENDRFDEGDGGPVKSDEASARSDVSHSRGSLLFAECLHGGHVLFVGFVEWQDSEI